MSLRFVRDAHPTSEFPANLELFSAAQLRRERLTGLGLVLSSALLLAGCGNPVQRKLEGRWLGESVENFDAKDVAAATGWARGLSLEFSGTRLTVAVPAEEPRTGKYKVASVHENDVELAVTRVDGVVDTRQPQTRRRTQPPLHDRRHARGRAAPRAVDSAATARVAGLRAARPSTF